MAFKIDFYPKAEVEYNSAFKWYEDRVSGLGVRFEYSVGKAISNIANNPLGYPNKKYDCHEYIVDDFPYLIIYKLYPETKTILILSVFHTSRNPKEKYRF